MSQIYLLRHNEPSGPFSEEELRAQVARGELTPTDYAWREGMADWRTLSEVVTLSVASAAPTLPPPPPSPSGARPRAAARPQKRVPPVHVMTGLTEFLEVFPDRLTITPKGGQGFKTKGSRGIRTIPLHTLTAIAFKLPPFTSGLLEFSLSGDARARQGTHAKTGDEGGNGEGGAYENMFRFLKDDESIAAAGRITEYVEERLRESRAAPTLAGSGGTLSDELAKLAALRGQGVLTDEEFQQAKGRLLAGS